MSSDRARISDDPGRTWRAVVQQQGRVTIEADGNEASRLAETALREDVLDIVGAMGTPDDGFAVEQSGVGFVVTAGTYYLGGWRVVRTTPLTVPGGDEALDLPAGPLADGRHAVALLLTEQEVGAVEDRALREVALGGPDTAQRTRLMQRAVAVSVQGDDCAGAAGAIAAALTAEGGGWDAATGAIVSTARLRVSMVAAPAPADPCDPPASGGYLGADNQLIRVSVTAYDAATGRGSLVWGYNNAATMYRAATSDGIALTLEAPPIDSDHTPRLGQAVEVLQTRTRFDHGDVVAADAGIVTSIAQPYDPDLQRVRIAATLPAGSRGSAAQPLFLRLWEAEIAFQRGVAIELGDTGLAVTLTLDAFGSTVVARPFWTFAARPSTPVIVYPRRYLDGLQPPEGPRQWLAPLAVVEVARQTLTVLDDCRDEFLPLTKLRPGCCGITLDPDTRHRDAIQRALDRLRGTRGTVTLRPGRYRLRVPIRLDASHKGLTLEGCGEGVFLEAANEDDEAFATGLIVLDDVNEVALRWLQFQMPSVPLDRARLRAFELMGAEAERGDGAVAITATGCAQLTIADCQFRYRFRPRSATFAIGVLGRGECWGLRLHRNRFLHDIDYPQRDENIRLLFGYVLVPGIALDRERMSARQLSDARLDALLEDAEIVDNRFVGLTVATLVYARLGYVRIERNRVDGCVGGMMLVEASAGGMFKIADTYDMGYRTAIPTEALAGTMTFAAALPGGGSDSGEAIVNADLQRVNRASDARVRDYAEGDESVDAVGGGAQGDEVDVMRGLQRVSTAIEARHTRLVAKLHVHANDLDVMGELLHPRAVPDESRDGSPRKRPGIPGLGVFLERLARGGGDMVATGNRIASRMNPAAVVVFPQRLVFASNLVSGSGGDDFGGAAIINLDGREGKLEVMGNVFDLSPDIRPNTRPQTPSAQWAFVNRIE
jgi:hypothetical protein